ncbi:MAG: lytic transglycosylase domain-containing protein [Oligoflexia bacterium]|nr:lytic transglycosylase domain-containing protein [Oligoflexia bacterium]
MRIIRELLTGIILYIAIPATILYGAFVVSDKEGDRIANAFTFLQSDLVKPALESAPIAEAQIDAREVKIVETVNKIDIQKKLDLEDDINKIPLEFVDHALNTDDVLSDRLNRLSPEFKVPAVLRDRVKFWFDIYTKYSSRFSVIHHQQYPWIIFAVVDARNIYAQPTSRFTKDANERNSIANAKNNIRNLLTNLASKKKYTKLSAEEFRLYKLLESVPGKRQQVFKTAAYNVRDQRGQKNYYRSGIVHSSKYINEMEEIFARYDLPVELVRLPLVESSFNEAAQSKVGASGIWQFMVGTGTYYLKVGDQIDERNSPIKATEAAAKLMLSNFKILRSWPLAVTAYNHGPGGLFRAKKQLRTTALSEIIKKYKSPSFGFASMNFYCEFLAALHGEKYQDEIFGTMDKHLPLEADTIDLKYSMRARTLTDIVGITMEELKLYNPDLKNKTIAANTYLPVGYHIRLPVGRKARMELFHQQAEDAHSIVNDLDRKNRS